MTMQKHQEQHVDRRTFIGSLILSGIISVETFYFLYRSLLANTEYSLSFPWGYSNTRLAVLILFSLALLASCVAQLKAFLWYKGRIPYDAGWPFLLTQEWRRWIIRFLAIFICFLILLTFDPTSFSRFEGYFRQIRPLLIWSILVCGQTLLFVAVNAHISGLLELSGRNIFCFVLSTFLISLWVILRTGMVGRSSISWMTYFQASEFLESEYGVILEFFKEMRSGIPPLLAFLEIVNLKVLGSTKIITDEFYRLALLFSYFLSGWLFSNKIGKGVASILLALIFLPATAFISAQNPEIYDVYFPFFFLSFIFFSQPVFTSSNNRKHGVIAAFLSGLFLSMAELSRPFVLIFLPIIFLHIFLAYRGLPKKYLVAFLVPFLLISGGWHLKLIILNNGQLFWSNHSGFNLYRAWGDVIDDPQLVDEPQTWDNRSQIHTQEHFENSKRIQSAVVSYIVSHPVEGIKQMAERIGTFLLPRIALLDLPEPQGFYPWIYRIAFYVAFIHFIFQLIRMLIGFIAKPSLTIFANSQHMLLTIIAGSILILAIAEKGEEARLLLNVLPLLASLPRFQPLKDLAVEGSYAR